MGKVVDLEKFRKERERRLKDAADRRERRANRIKDTVAKESGAKDNGATPPVTKHSPGDATPPEDDTA